MAGVLVRRGGRDDMGDTRQQIGVYLGGYQVYCNIRQINLFSAFIILRLHCLVVFFSSVVLHGCYQVWRGGAGNLPAHEVAAPVRP